MTHPSSYDDIPYLRVAIYTLWKRYRIQLWTWPVEWQYRILGAAIDADPDLDEVAASVCRVAQELMKGESDEPGTGRKKGGEGVHEGGR